MDPSRSAAELERVVRALSPHVGAYVELDDGMRLGVTCARAVAAGEGRHPPAIACADGELQLLSVKPPGRREMSGEEWLRGLRR